MVGHYDVRRQPSLEAMNHQLTHCGRLGTAEQRPGVYVCCGAHASCQGCLHTYVSAFALAHCGPGADEMIDEKRRYDQNAREFNVIHSSAL